MENRNREKKVELEEKVLQINKLYDLVAKYEDTMCRIEELKDRGFLSEKTAQYHLEINEQWFIMKAEELNQSLI